MNVGFLRFLLFLHPCASLRGGDHVISGCFCMSYHLCLSSACSSQSGRFGSVQFIVNTQNCLDRGGNKIGNNGGGTVIKTRECDRKGERGGRERHRGIE